MVEKVRCTWCGGDGFQCHPGYNPNWQSTPKCKTCGGSGKIEKVRMPKPVPEKAPEQPKGFEFL
jgi:DnaJ-class molecular chaperone